MIERKKKEEKMYSLKITKETNFAQVNDFQQKTDIILRKYGIDAEAAIRVDYGDTIHSDGERVFVQKGQKQ
jgi:hypothetical protein